MLAWSASVAFSPDGTHLISGSYDKTAKLWDVATGTLLHTFEGHSNDIDAVGFSSDGGQVATGSKDESVRIWDRDTGRLLKKFEALGGWSTALAYLHGQKQILVGHFSGRLNVLDVETGAVEPQSHFSGGVSALAVSSDDSVVVGHGVGAVLLWRLPNDTGKLTLEGGSFRAL